MEDGMEAGESDGEVKAVRDGRNDPGDGEGAEETRTEFGGGVISEREVVGGETNTVTNRKCKLTTVTVGLLSLACLGQVQLTSNRCLDVADVFEKVGDIRG